MTPSPTTSDEFQSTHPVWDATSTWARTTLPKRFQSTHPVWDATVVTSLCLSQSVFQSTHPVWDATEACLSSASTHQISIHASRVGCDRLSEPLVSDGYYFNPRIPCGMRRAMVAFDHQIRDFNPRIPCGMRLHSVLAFDIHDISIHASRVGCDFILHPLQLDFRFQSTHPVWDATCTFICISHDDYFNPRIPCGMRQPQDLQPQMQQISIHASRVGCDIQNSIG